MAKRDQKRVTPQEHTYPDWWVDAITPGTGPAYLSLNGAHVQAHAQAMLHHIRAGEAEAAALEARQAARSYAVVEAWVGEIATPLWTD